MSDGLDASFVSDTPCNHCDLKELVTTTSMSTSTPAGTPNHHHPTTSSINMNNKKYTINKPKTDQKRRLMEKNGKCKLSYMTHANKTKRRFAADLFTTSVDMPWRYNILMVAACYTLSWLFFGFVYWSIACWRGDFNHIDDAEWKPCFRNFKDFNSAFLYSMETQSTIGYGFRSPTEKCQEAMIMVLVQVIWANFVEAFVISSFLAKISRPKLRASTLIFSESAVISEREGNLCFMIRMADLRHSPIVEGHVRLMLMKHHTTSEGEVIPMKTYDLDIGHSIGLDRMFLVWPSVITHVIDNKSPLYKVSKEIMESVHFEVMVIFEGIVEATGTTTQARTSYLHDEILWGHRFEEVMVIEQDQVKANMSKFHKTYAVYTPTCSARELYEGRGYTNYNPQAGDEDDDDDEEEDSVILSHGARRRVSKGDPISWSTARHVLHMESRI